MTGWEAVGSKRFVENYESQPARVVAVERDGDTTVALLGYTKSRRGQYVVAAVQIDEQRVGKLEPEMELRSEPKLGHYATPDSDRGGQARGARDRSARA